MLSRLGAVPLRSPSQKVSPSLTYRYPPQSDPRIQTIISSKPEFSSLSLDGGTARKVGKLFVHQLFASRMIRTYDNFIIFNEVGTGKTGVMYACANHCARNYGLDPVIAYRRGACSTIRKVVFLAHNEANMRNIEGEYRRYTEDAGANPPEQFNYATHGSWWVDNRNKSDQELRSEWDNTLFIIDEAHILLTRSNIDGKATAMDEEPEMYKWYRQTFAKLRGIKLMLLTASILVERALELGYYLRLFPGVNVPTDEEFYKRPTAAAELEKYINGRVSYVKAVSAKAVRVYPDAAVPLADLMPGARPGPGEALDAPTRINTGGIKLVMLTMSKMQTEEYLAVARLRRDKDTNVALERRIALITYTGTKPGQRKGGRGHKKPPGGIAAPPALEFLSSLHPRLPGQPIEGTLDERAVKLAYILANIRKGGVAFIVTSYVEHGTNVIGAILAGNGYEQLNPKDEHLSSRKKRVRVKEGMDPMNDLPKRERFAIIGDSSRTSPSDIIRLTTYCNRDENVFGEYLRVVIISPAGATGLNVYHTIDYFEIDTSWNGEQEAQREGRIFRATSHDAQWRMKTMMKPTSRGPVEVRMHHLVAVPDYSIAPADTRIGDLYDYQHIYTKDAPLRYWRHFLMANSYDAQIHQARNGVKPASPAPAAEDRSTYELIYAPEEIIKTFDRLGAVLMRVGSIDADEYWDRYGTPIYSRRSYYLALTRVIRDRSEIVTPMGTHVFVRAVGNMLFGEAVRYARTSRALSAEYYPDTIPYLAPLVYRVVPLSEMVVAKDTTRASALPYPDVESMFEFLDDPQVDLAPKIEAIERVLAVGADINPPLFQAVRERYIGKSYFEYPRYGAILRTVEAYASLASRGSTYQFPIPSEAKTLEDMRNPTVPIVRLHNLYAQFDENKQTHYGTYDQYMNAQRLRIYDPTTRSFVAMPPDSPEFIVYSRIASNHVQARYATLRERREGSLVKMLVYDPEGKVRVFNQMSEPRISKAGDMVKSTLPTGRILATVSTAQMIDVALYLGLWPEVLPKVPARKAFYRLDAQGRYQRDQYGNEIPNGAADRIKQELLNSGKRFDEVLWRDRYDDPVELWRANEWSKRSDISTMEYLKNIIYHHLRGKGLVFAL